MRNARWSAHVVCASGLTVCFSAHAQLEAFRRAKAEGAAAKRVHVGAADGPGATADAGTAASGNAPAAAAAVCAAPGDDAVIADSVHQPAPKQQLEHGSKAAALGAAPAPAAAALVPAAVLVQSVPSQLSPPPEPAQRSQQPAQPLPDRAAGAALPIAAAPANASAAAAPDLLSGRQLEGAENSSNFGAAAVGGGGSAGAIPFRAPQSAPRLSVPQAPASSAEVAPVAAAAPPPSLPWPPRPSWGGGAAPQASDMPPQTQPQPQSRQNTPMSPFASALALAAQQTSPVGGGSSSSAAEPAAAPAQTPAIGAEHLAGATAAAAVPPDATAPLASASLQLSRQGSQTDSLAKAASRITFERSHSPFIALSRTASERADSMTSLATGAAGPFDAAADAVAADSIAVSVRDFRAASLDSRPSGSFAGIAAASIGDGSDSSPGEPRHLPGHVCSLPQQGKHFSSQ